MILTLLLTKSEHLMAAESTLSDISIITLMSALPGSNDLLLNSWGKMTTAYAGHPDRPRSDIQWPIHFEPLVLTQPSIYSLMHESF